MTLTGVDLMGWRAATASAGDGVVTGTQEDDRIDASFVDADGDFLSIHGQAINGLGGNDEIHDGSGDDTLSGGAGIDSFYISGGSDIITDFDMIEEEIEIAGAIIDPNQAVAGMTISQSGADVVISHGAGDSLQLTGIDLAAWQALTVPVAGGTVTGTSGDDTIDAAYVDGEGDTIDDFGQLIQGLDGLDVIYDGAGDDTVEGGDGRDTFYAGAGADQYDGGASSSDELLYSLSDIGLTINASNVANNTGIAAGDSYAAVERLQGTDYDDILVTGGSVQTLKGRAGDDHLFDDAGKDFLIGGAGADTFHLIAGDNQQDRIYDFELNIDQIDLSDWGVTDVSELSFRERIGSNGTPKGDLIIEFGNEMLRVDGYGSIDIMNFNESQFIFN